MKNAKITESEYIMSKEALYGALFTTSNGYMGIRGSFEENATLSVQGGFVRGLIDEIPFNQPLSIENEYMRKFYVNEDAAKDAEVQEGVINFCDILLVRISIDGETFYPWEGRILSWERTLDIENNCLVRTVLWESGKGDVTELCFERFASFANDHIYAQRVKVTPKNHEKEIEITSGVDLRTKSGGFKMCELKSADFTDNSVSFKLRTKGKYNHEFNIFVQNSFETDKNTNDGKFLTQSVKYKSEKDKSYVLEKKTFIVTSRDTDGATCEREMHLSKSYNELFSEHKAAWSEFFAKININIEGDDRADTALRFCSYHTAVSIPRNDSVHSLAAKNLTGEGYNDYVWWDCEIYQCPVFVYAGIDSVKNVLMYRYDRLSAAKEIAKAEGRCGARYPFISSVTGEEKVWKHVRHPYMQYHVVADVAWSVLNYYAAASDDEFMEKYGIEILSEICDYWVSRVEEVNGRYEISGVTGCDEHHPYVNNDAYTNYLVHYVLENTARLCKKLKKTENSEWKKVADKLYLPMGRGGLIPQFDGYFDLSKSLQSEGGGTGSFQMKTAGGMYHKSQVIKQPDVMVLFSHLPISFDKSVYERNWDYYEAMCEASSSLTFPVHAICAFDNNQLYKGYKYFMECAEMDLCDLHGCAKDGVHAGCSAGAWYAVVRGLAGIEMQEEYVKIDTKMLPWWESVSFNLKWQGSEFGVKIDNEKVIISPKAPITVNHRGKIFAVQDETELSL
ncbi:MAG: glycoside hydrolase family 65 protein [Clostridia bacterium]|nr:glycoside hydrolase family 65 protein [Clostridia bacterium]